MKANQYWEIDNVNVAKVHSFSATSGAIKDEPNLELFFFDVKRYKNKDTQKEMLEISATVSGDASGTIMTDLVKIEEDLLKFRAYGIVMPRRMFTELSRAISENYYKLEKIDFDESVIVEDIISKEVLDEILAMFAAYFGESEIDSVVISGQDLYCISVKDFNEVVKDSDYKRFNPSDIKEALRDNGSTVVNKGRFDYVVSDNGKKVRKVCFKKDVIEQFI